MKKRSTSLIAGILCLAAAAAWHSLDVRAGIHETGASWQTGRYLLLIVLVLVLTTVCGYFLLEKAVLSAEAGSAYDGRSWHPLSLCSAAAYGAG